MRSAAILTAAFLLVAGCRDKEPPEPTTRPTPTQTTTPKWHPVTKKKEDAKPDVAPPAPSPEKYVKVVPVVLPKPEPLAEDTHIAATLVKKQEGVAVVWGRPVDGDRTEILWQSFDEYKGLVGSPKRLRITSGSVQMIVATRSFYGDNRIGWCSKRAEPDTTIYGLAWIDDWGMLPYPVTSLAVVKGTSVASTWAEACHLSIAESGEGALVMRQNGVMRDAVEEGSAKKEWKPAYVLEEAMPSEPADCIVRGSSDWQDRPGPLVNTDEGFAYVPGHTGFSGAAIIIEERTSTMCAKAPCETSLANADPEVLAWTGSELVVIGSHGDKLVIGVWRDGTSVLKVKEDEQVKGDIYLPEIKKSEIVCDTGDLAIIVHVDGEQFTIKENSKRYYTESIPWAELLSVLGHRDYSSVINEDGAVYILTGRSILYGECWTDGIKMKKMGTIPVDV